MHSQSNNPNTPSAYQKMAFYSENSLDLLTPPPSFALLLMLVAIKIHMTIASFPFMLRPHICHHTIKILTIVFRLHHLVLVK